MELTELNEVLESLIELSPDIDDFSWGPSYELAMQRRKRSIEIINKEIAKCKKCKNLDFGERGSNDNETKILY